ncbi:MAG: hypothetical protein FGM61_12795, partial [Sediminibacterium sp.]|nr:hypothetical protein [Sediminibacterium sp.]
MKRSFFQMCLVMVLSLCSFTLLAQTKKITGKILREDSKGLAGASVTVKGKNTGTLTNQNGDYTINAATGDLLVIALTGYGTREVKVGTGSVINAALEVKVSELDAVVVTGYGTQKRKEVTGAVSSVSSQAFEHSPSTNVATVLQGNA